MDRTSTAAGFTIRRLHPGDVDALYDLASKNEIFYQYHPPFITRERLLEDMEALPPGRTAEDKFFLGFFEGCRLAAVMDLILGYPEEGAAWIGWFMVERELQGRGVGTEIIQSCEAYLAKRGYGSLRLAIDQGNPQSRAFWTKNGFVQNGKEIPNEVSAYIPMKKELQMEAEMPRETCMT